MGSSCNGQLGVWAFIVILLLSSLWFIWNNCICKIPAHYVSTPSNIRKLPITDVVYSSSNHFYCYFRNQNCTAKNSYICEKNKNSQYVTSTQAPGSTTEGITTTQTTTTPAPPTASCNCGLINRQSRIVGGVETSANKYPWMVRGHGDCQ